jgi:hypothetical protein
LGLTAAIEGHGFTLAQGNFDGAGITWGIIGFTLKHGELTRIVLDLEAHTPGIVERAFEEDTDRLLAVLRAPLAAQLAFADDLSIPARKVRLAEPWRSRFDWFGTFPEGFKPRGSAAPAKATGSRRWQRPGGLGCRPSWGWLWPSTSMSKTARSRRRRHG